jgi:DeoR family transcriptional regulator of aga operon/DeoR family fructose operon transcriptional repressor
MNNLTAKTRRRRIVEALDHEGNVQVEDLADRFGVSQVTIRKDLAELEEQGLLQRTYGGAVYSHRSRFNFSFFEKLKLHSKKKEWIAEAALSYIHEGDTLFLDSGSTTLALAQALPGRFHSLYIITSSVPAALELSKAAYEILLVGGQVRNHSLALIGPVAVKTIAQYHADRAFLGTSGISLTHGHSTPNPFDGEVKQAMIRSADESYVLTDSSKFGHACLTSFAKLEEVDTILTDAGIPSEFHEVFSNRGIGLRIVDPEDKIAGSALPAVAAGTP